MYFLFFFFFKDAINHFHQRFAHISFLLREKRYFNDNALFINDMEFYIKKFKIIFSFYYFVGYCCVIFFSSKVSDGIV